MAAWWQVSKPLTLYMLLLSAVLGAVLASFFGCAVQRTCSDQSFTHGRSHCDACGHTLGVLDLIPVLSWFCLRGRCRYCGAKIPAWGTVTEALTAAAFAALVWCYGLTLQTLQYLVFAAILLLISLTDWQTGLIPDRFQLAGIASFVLFAALRGGWRMVLAGVGSGLLVAVPMLVLTLIMDRVLGRESMGGGDLKLFFVAGLYLPWQQLLVFVIFACVAGIVLALATQKTTNDPDNPNAYPFGPAIALAAVVCLVFGQPVVEWYLGLF
jgi:leader peptidase (prepilin peptidase)/N-methyltransferase